jgi:hypothetical protein
MGEWQVTHGQVRGAYLNMDGVELYARQDGENGSRWLMFVDGQPVAKPVSSEKVARSSLELLARAKGMVPA